VAGAWPAGPCCSRLEPWWTVGAWAVAPATGRPAGARLCAAALVLPTALRACAGLLGIAPPAVLPCNAATRCTAGRRQLGFRAGHQGGSRLEGSAGATLACVVRGLGFWGETSGRERRLFYWAIMQLGPRNNTWVQGIFWAAPKAMAWVALGPVPLLAGPDAIRKEKYPRCTQ
jgi:hypothetical protein